jgi:hypothetical protein
MASAIGPSKSILRVKEGNIYGWSGSQALTSSAVTLLDYNNPSYYYLTRINIGLDWSSQGAGEVLSYTVEVDGTGLFIEKTVLTDFNMGYQPKQIEFVIPPKLIAIAEPIPTIDLNLPRPVVLASLYHSTDEALDVLTDVINYIKDLEIPSADDIIDEAKKEIEEFVDEKTGEGITDRAKFIADWNACKKNAKDTLGIAYHFETTGIAWITSCMVQKGYTRAIVEEGIKTIIGV